MGLAVLVRDSNEAGGPIVLRVADARPDVAVPVDRPAALVDGVLSFGYPSLLESIRETARAVAAGRLGLARARKDREFRRWLDQLEERWVAKADDPEDVYLDLDERFDRATSDVAGGQANLASFDGPFAVYLSSDEPALEAAWHLGVRLPHWARRRDVTRDGALVPLVVLEVGRSIEQLAVWLARPQRTRSRGPAAAEEG